MSDVKIKFYVFFTVRNHSQAITKSSSYFIVHGIDLATSISDDGATPAVDAVGDAADLNERRRKKNDVGFHRRNFLGIGQPNLRGKLQGTLRSKYLKMYHHQIRFR